jgi:hypothetical protein
VLPDPPMAFVNEELVSGSELDDELQLLNENMATAVSKISD